MQTPASNKIRPSRIPAGSLTVLNNAPDLHLSLARLAVIYSSISHSILASYVQSKTADLLLLLLLLLLLSLIARQRRDIPPT